MSKVEEHVSHCCANLHELGRVLHSVAALITHADSADLLHQKGVAWGTGDLLNDIARRIKHAANDLHPREQQKIARGEREPAPHHWIAWNTEE